MRFAAIISSVKPFKDDTYTSHQKAAIASWGPLCDRVILFNNREDIGDIVPVELVKPKLSPPTVKQMLEDTRTTGVIAIVNSDIILTPKILRCLEVAEEKGFNSTWAATSFRYEGDPPEVRGQGLDVFVLSSRIVDEILRDIPDHMTIGRTLWDNWLNGRLLCCVRTSHYFDMTPWKCVFHPLHTGGEGQGLTKYTEEQVAKIFAAGQLSCDGIPKAKYT